MSAWPRRTRRPTPTRPPGKPPAEPSGESSDEPSDGREIRDTHEVIGAVKTLVDRLNVLAGRLERYVDAHEGNLHAPTGPPRPAGGAGDRRGAPGGDG